MSCTLFLRFYHYSQLKMIFKVTKKLYKVRQLLFLIINNIVHNNNNYSNFNFFGPHKLINYFLLLLIFYLRGQQYRSLFIFVDY